VAQKADKVRPVGFKGSSDSGDVPSGTGTKHAHVLRANDAAIYMKIDQSCAGDRAIREVQQSLPV
jgi:hypothetical protein